MRIAILTCDKYNWLIPYFWHFFKKNFPDNPYPVDFVTETEEVCFGNNMFYGGKVPWSTLLRNYLSTVKDDRILILLDDYIILGANLELLEIAEGKCKDDIGCINLYPYDANLMLPTMRDDKYSVYNFNKTRTIGVQATIWQTQYLLDVYPVGLNPWDSEYKGYSNMQKLYFAHNKQILFSPYWIFSYTLGGCMKKGIRQQKVWNDIKEKW